MTSLSFPNMLSTTHANIISDKEAVKSNLILLLNSEKKTLFGDPEFGTSLRQILFEQQSSLVVDLVIDELYNTIMTFIPQVYLDRRDIELLTEGSAIYARIKCTYRQDSTSDLFTLVLMDE